MMLRQGTLRLLRVLRVPGCFALGFFESTTEFFRCVLCLGISFMQLLLDKDHGRVVLLLQSDVAPALLDGLLSQRDGLPLAVMQLRAQAINDGCVIHDCRSGCQGRDGGDGCQGDGGHCGGSCPQHGSTV